MELKYRSADKELDQSFYLRREHRPYLGGNWHYHEEFELIYIVKGNGIRIVGDSLSNFGAGELALVGPWVPHLWKNFGSKNEEETVDVIIVKFTRLIGGQDIFSIPEFGRIFNLLKQSERGLLFGGKTTLKLHDLLISMASCEGADKIIKLLISLKYLSEYEDYKFLSSVDFTLPTIDSGENRLSKIINYISNNFFEQISLEELAKEAAMTPSSLCRFFKNRTNKTLSQFINEFRVGKASQMLISGNQSVSEICFDSGFNSLTSFNRVFKAIKKMTPGQFKENYYILSKKQ